MLRGLINSLVPRSVTIHRLRRNDARTVLLTFDDGPHRTVTPAVLDRLESHDARAVFFVIGKFAEQSADLLDEIVRRGHLLGNHSYTHSEEWFAPNKPPPFKTFRDDVGRCQKLLDSYLHDRPRLFRPPGGRLTASSILTAKVEKLRCVTWSKEVKDWSFRRPEEGRVGGEILSDIVESRDIVLLHDDNPIVLDLLDVLLPNLSSKNYDLRSGIDYV